MLKRSFSPEMVSTIISFVISSGRILLLAMKLRFSNLDMASALDVVKCLMSSRIKVRKA